MFIIFYRNECECVYINNFCWFPTNVGRSIMFGPFTPEACFTLLKNLTAACLIQPYSSRRRIFIRIVIILVFRDRDSLDCSGGCPGTHSPTRHIILWGKFSEFSLDSSLLNSSYHYTILCRQMYTLKIFHYKCRQQLKQSDLEILLHNKLMYV